MGGHSTQQMVVLEVHSIQEMVDQVAHFTPVMVDLGGHSILEMADQEVPSTLKMVDQEDHFIQGVEARVDLFILKAMAVTEERLSPPKIPVAGGTVTIHGGEESEPHDKTQT